MNLYLPNKLIHLVIHKKRYGLHFNYDTTLGFENYLMFMLRNNICCEFEQLITQKVYKYNFPNIKHDPNYISIEVNKKLSKKKHNGIL